jgi:hypothetical protein
MAKSAGARLNKAMLIMVSGGEKAEGVGVKEA